MKAKHKQILILLTLVITNLFFIGILQYSQSTVQAEDCTSSIKKELIFGEEVQSAWIILVGDTETHKGIDILRNAGNTTYEALRTRGFAPEKIFYMGPTVNQTTQPYVNTSSTIINLEWAIKEWAPLHVNSNQSLGIALISHGDYDAIAMMVNGVALWDTTFNSYLNTFEATTGCKRIILIMEACRSGSFVYPVSKDNRIIVTSAHTLAGAAYNADDTNGAFTESFWSSIASSDTIGTAFEKAVIHVRNLGSHQAPQIDDDHSGKGHTVPPYGSLPQDGDGSDALNVKIQAFPTTNFPKIEVEMVPLPIYEIWDPFTSVINMEVEIGSSTGISKVYARFIPSTWEPTDPLDGFMFPINDATVKLVELDPLVDGVYFADVAFNGLALGDSFKVNIFAYDDNGMVSDIVNTYLYFNADGETPLDTEIPSIAIVMPPPDDSLNGMVEIIAQGDDNQALENIDLYIDGLLVDSLVMPDHYPYPKLQFMCNTSLYDEGKHNITAVARDTAGLSNQTSIVVKFDNLNNEIIYYAAGIGGGVVIIGSAAVIVRFLMRKKAR